MWESEYVAVTADEALMPTSDRQSTRQAAESFLCEELKGGNEVACKGLYERAAEQGISKKVLWSVKQKLKVVARKSAFDEGWMWRLPVESTSEDSQNTKIPISDLGIFDERESSQGGFTGVI